MHALSPLALICIPLYSDLMLLPLFSLGPPLAFMASGLVCGAWVSGFLSGLFTGLACLDFGVGTLVRSLWVPVVDGS